jgi:hypothetical protein
MPLKSIVKGVEQNCRNDFETSRFWTSLGHVWYLVNGTGDFAQLPLASWVVHSIHASSPHCAGLSGQHHGLCPSFVHRQSGAISSHRARAAPVGAALPTSILAERLFTCEISVP